QARYRLLEPIRQYAHALLEVEGEAAAARACHATHYLDFAEGVALAVFGDRMGGPFGRPDQIAWFARLEREHDNLRAALAWDEQGGRLEALARLCVALWGFWQLQGHMAEGRRWLEVAVARGVDLPVALRARLVGPAGILAVLRGEYAAALGPLEEGVALNRS